MSGQPNTTTADTPQVLLEHHLKQLRRVGGGRVRFTAHRVTSPADVSETTIVVAESSVM